jgi:hypothetical protein
VHLIPASVEHGFDEVTAAGMLAAMAAFDLVGTTFSGWLSDFAAGEVHTLLGDDLVAFLTAGVLCLIASGLILGLTRRIAAPPLVIHPGPIDC